MTGLALSEMGTAADLELVVAHLVFRWLILRAVANLLESRHSSIFY